MMSLPLATDELKRRVVIQACQFDDCDDAKPACKNKSRTLKHVNKCGVVFRVEVLGTELAN